MSYGYQFWGPTRNQHIKDVISFEKKAVRIINISGKYTAR